VCAHLDTKSDKQLAYAPGADDNASGCAAVVELARILSGQTFAKTIKFVLFSREETGQQGSKAFAKTARANNENIVAAINLDMIARGNDAEDIDLVTRPAYSWLAEDLEQLGVVYGVRTRKVIEKGCY
jgi:Zn-dependent M28 family amino/carboxypeptidase